MIEVRIYTPNGPFAVVPEVSIVNVDTTDGQRGILPSHMPIVLMLTIGQLELGLTNKREKYTISSGMLYFENDVATILVDSIENIKDIDINRAKEAKERAIRRLQEHQQNIDEKRAKIALSKAINRIHAYEENR